MIKQAYSALEISLPSLQFLSYPRIWNLCCYQIYTMMGPKLPMVTQGPLLSYMRSKCVRVSGYQPTDLFSSGSWFFMSMFFLLHDTRPHQTAIFTESLSSLEAFLNRQTFPSCEIIEHHTVSIKSGTSVRFVSTPCHVGVFGNEATDRAAKTALLSGSEDDIPYTIMSKWQWGWDQSTHSHFFYDIKKRVMFWKDPDRSSDRIRTLVLVSVIRNHALIWLQVTHKVIWMWGTGNRGPRE